MTVVSAQTLRMRQPIQPFVERTKAEGMTYGLGPAGYDVRIAEDFSLASKEFRLASTVEHFRMPNDMIAFVYDKSTWARRGLSLFNTVIEPGWDGFLTLELTNHSPDFLNFRRGMPICQIVFHFLDQATDTPYSGKYQHQQAGAVPPIYES